VVISIFTQYLVIVVHTTIRHKVLYSIDKGPLLLASLFR